MHKIDTFLARLSVEIREKVLSIVERIQERNLSGLDVRKLKGSPDIYRVLLGKLRVKFVMNESEIRILSTDNCGENTYRDI
jgi:mRNA-degrading endonuclease RelE of RelBE toxin-antitoxin system